MLQASNKDKIIISTNLSKNKFDTYIEITKMLLASLKEWVNNDNNIIFLK